MWRIERRMEINKRKERRKNIIIRRIEVGAGEERAVVEKLPKKVGAEVKVEYVNRVGEREKGEEMILARLGNKGKVMRRKVLKWRKK